MSEPTTQAGKRLLEGLQWACDVDRLNDGGTWDDTVHSILAIEAEAAFIAGEPSSLHGTRSQILDLLCQQARADLAARIEARVADLMPHEFIDTYEPGTFWIAVDRAAVLDAIREEAERAAIHKEVTK